MYELIKKYISPLSIVIGLEIIGTILLMVGLAPRELVFFLTGVFIFFVLFAPLKQAVLFTVFSIPLYVALPISESFDSMAVWRIIVAILFLRVLLRSPQILSFGSFSPAQRLAPRLGLFWSRLRSSLTRLRSGHHAKTALKSATRQYPRTSFLRLSALVGLFFFLGILSLFVAPEPIFGIKKLIYLANIFALFFVIKAIIKTKEDFTDILKYILGASLVVLLVGYAQFLFTLFVPLYNFWQWWAHNVILVFYGANLSNLLSYSNTWFSYYEEAEATLRMFSVFPDSHSFALFMVISLPVALTFFVTSKRKKFNFDKNKLNFGEFARHVAYKWIFLGGAIILMLLAIILSGTRGVWVGAVPVFLLLIIFFALFFVPRQFCVGPRIFQSFAGKILGIGPSSASVLRIRSVFLLTIASFLLFALLFPVSSQLLKFSQMRQGGQVSETAFERISTSFDIRELSNKGRIQIWESTFKSIAKHPFWGVGIGNYPVVLDENISSTKEGASAHSLYLDVVSEMGIFAGIVLLLIFFEILRQALKLFVTNEDLIMRAFAGFFAVYLLWLMVYSVVDVVLLNDKVLLLFTTIVGVLYAGFNQHSRV